VLSGGGAGSDGGDGGGGGAGAVAGLAAMRVDGGMAVNDWLLQFLADVCGATVARPAVLESTAWGAAALAGLHCGVFESLDDIAAAWQRDREFTPATDATPAIAGWQEALARVKTAGQGGG